MDKLVLAGQTLPSRLWLGSSLYPSPHLMAQALQEANPGMVTLSLRRQSAAQLGEQVAENSHWQLVQNYVADSGALLLPNTAGCHSAREAILLAQLARELFNSRWIKLEVIGDDYSLAPHPLELVAAAKELIAQGFMVLPYCSDDLVLCRTLLELGCSAVMPAAAPIGSGRGLLNPYQLELLRRQLSDAVLVIDAGLGKPSQAAQALEMGFDAVLLNTAVARSPNPVLMAAAFAQAVAAGRRAYLAGIMPEQLSPNASTSNIGLPFWQQAAAL